MESMTGRKRVYRWMAAAAACGVVLAMPAAMAQVVTASGPYCITGTSSGVAYSWWIDGFDDGLGFAGEPKNLTAGPVTSGSGPAALASDFAGSIAAVGSAQNWNFTAAATGNCFDILFGVSGTCTAATCVGGPRNGQACIFNNPDCGIDPNAPVSLRVGAASSTPSCKVTASGCSYNPIIVLGPVPVPTVPALGSWGMALLAVLLVTAGGAVLLRRLRAARRVI